MAPCCQHGIPPKHHLGINVILEEDWRFGTFSSKSVSGDIVEGTYQSAHLLSGGFVFYALNVWSSHHHLKYECSALYHTRSSPIVL